MSENLKPESELVVRKYSKYMADLFDGIDTIVPGNQGNGKLTEGEYLVRVEDVIHTTTENKGDAFIVEYTVLETSDPAKHPIGVKRSWYQPMLHKKIAMEEIVKFMYAALGYDAKRDAERIAKEVTPNIKAWTNAACRKPAKDPSTGADIPGKVMNGLVSMRVSVRKKPPSEKKKLQAAAIGAPPPAPFDNPYFSPASPNPPPVRAS